MQDSKIEWLVFGLNPPVYEDLVTTDKTNLQVRLWKNSFSGRNLLWFYS